MTERPADPTPEAMGLLPCPCCGARAIFGEVTDPDSENFGGVFIECTSCIITTDLRFSSKEDARPLLAEQWNSRAAIDAFAKAAVERERERCLRHANQTAQTHLDARDKCLAEHNQQGALTQARQAQTANYIGVRIWNGSEP